MKQTMILAAVVLALLLAPLAIAGPPGMSSSDGDSYDAIINRLDSTELERVDFRGEQISVVLRYLAEVSDVNFVATDALLEEDPEITITLQKGVTVRQFMKIVSQLATPKLKMYFDNGLVLVAPAEQVVQKPVLRIYDIGGLKIQIPDFPGPEIMLTSDSGFSMDDMSMDGGEEPMDGEEIADLIRSFTGGTSWDENESVDIQVRGNQLLVMQTPDVHRAISILLAQLGD